MDKNLGVIFVGQKPEWFKNLNKGVFDKKL